MAGSVPSLASTTSDSRWAASSSVRSVIPLSCRPAVRAFRAAHMISIPATSSMLIALSLLSVVGVTPVTRSRTDRCSASAA
ncbi:hypothetical protein DNK55_27670 [Streptomyces sp. AC1-42T]|nr:hypothetical protein DNK55_27670 [Streptomyces sp. AC1-42T]